MTTEDNKSDVPRQKTTITETFTTYTDVESKRKYETIVSLRENS
jgi:hypothetical protein